MKKYIVLFLIVILLSGCGKNNEEKEVNKLMEEFYKKTITKEIDFPVIITISLSNLKNEGFDISKLEEAGCELDSYSKIDIKDIDNYEIKNFYECGE